MREILVLFVSLWFGLIFIETWCLCSEFLQLAGEHRDDIKMVGHICKILLSAVFLADQVDAAGHNDRSAQNGPCIRQIIEQKITVEYCPDKGDIIK